MGMWRILLLAAVGSIGYGYAHDAHEEIFAGERMPRQHAEYLDGCSMQAVRETLHDAKRVLGQDNVPPQCTRVVEKEEHITSFEAQHALVAVLMALDIDDEKQDTERHAIFNRVLTLLALLSKREEDMV